MESKIHVFEKAGLGLAPFRFVKMYECTYQACPGAPIQPGTVCDYCGTGIKDVYVIKSADGKQFKVGCDCVRKTGDKGMINLVLRAANALKTKRRHELEAEKIKAIKARWENPALKEHFSKLPHPTSYMAEKGHTYANYIDWMFAHAGNAGKLSIGKVLDRVNQF